MNKLNHYLIEKYLNANNIEVDYGSLNFSTDSDSDSDFDTITPYNSDDENEPEFEVNEDDVVFDESDDTDVTYVKNPAFVDKTHYPLPPIPKSSSIPEWAIYEFLRKIDYVDDIVRCTIPCWAKFQYLADKQTFINMI